MSDKEGTLYLKIRGEDVKVEAQLESGVLTLISTSNFDLLHTFPVSAELKVTGPLFVGDSVSFQIVGASLPKPLQLSHDDAEVVGDWITILKETQAENKRSEPEPEPEPKVKSYSMPTSPSPRRAKSTKSEEQKLPSPRSRETEFGEAREDRKGESAPCSPHMPREKNSSPSEPVLIDLDPDFRGPKKMDDKRASKGDLRKSHSKRGPKKCESDPSKLARTSPTGGKRVRSFSSSGLSILDESAPSFVKTKSALSLGRQSSKRKSLHHEPIMESSSDNVSPASEPFESKRDSGKYGSGGRSMFGGAKQWGSLFIGTFPGGGKSHSREINIQSISSMDDYPKVRPFAMDDVLDLDLHVSDSEDEETGAASFARKFNMELEGSPAVARVREVKKGEDKSESKKAEKKEDSSQQEPENEHEARRTHIAKEIYSTEKSYVESLGVCIEHYQAVLVKKCREIDETPETIAAIFGNMNILYGFNKKLLTEIEKIVQAWSSDSQLGATFFKLSPFLKMYTDYSNKYAEALATFTRLEKKNLKFKQVIDECYTASSHPCRVNDLLITPIQRIPRYSLLLTDLLNNTPQSHPDYEQLRKSLQSIQEVAVLVNEAVRRRENTMRLDEMQKEGYDLSHFIVSTRHLIKDGAIKVKVTKTVGNEQKTVTEAQYWILFNDTFVRCKKDGVKHVDLRDYAVPLSLLWLQSSKKEANLILPREILTFSDEAWDSKLSSAINAYVGLSDTIPKLRIYVADQNRPVVEGLRVGEYQDASGYYIGQWVLGKRNGKGKWEYKGNKYTGQWKDDKPNGPGRWTYATGSVHVGYFEEGTPHGLGTVKTADGTRWTGKLARGIRKGHGKIVYSNGDVFQGTWKNDRIQGEGRLICKNALTYVGEWNNNEFHGVGKLTLPSGVTYEGNFVRGCKQGRGCFKYPDGTTYVGDVEDGMRHGKGKIIVSEDKWYEGDWELDFPDGTGRKVWDESLYEGNWHRGFRSGYGRMTYADGGGYDGQWEYDKRHGEGVFVDMEGNSFTGIWQHDKLHGPGTAIYANGGKFEGMFKDGMRDKGKFTAAKGDCFLAYEGDWQRNIMHGKGTLTALDGTTYKGTFENGTISGDCTVTNGAKGTTMHANFVNDFKDGKITLGFGNDSLSGVLVSNTLINNSGLILNVEPMIPLFGRRLGSEAPPNLKHF